MFTLNWYRGLSAAMFGDTAIKYKSAANSDVTFNNNRGSMIFLKQWISSESAMTYAPNMANYLTSMGASTGGVMFGTGDTAPTINDYTLSGTVITDLTATATVVHEFVEDGVVITGVYLVTNATSSDITIREVGLFGKAQTSSTSSGKILMERTVLDAPVTIPSSGVGQVTYTIRMNYPTT